MDYGSVAANRDRDIGIADDLLSRTCADGAVYPAIPGGIDLGSGGRQ